MRRKIDRAGDLRSVVRTMKALAAASIGQYERSVRALVDYNRAVDMGLGLCLRSGGPAVEARADASGIGAVVFGSDQGLVGQFNDIVADHAIETLAAMPGKPQIWAVGERVYARLADAGLAMAGLFRVPHSVQATAPLVGQILVESEARRDRGDIAALYIFYNRPAINTVYAPVDQRLLPLDEAWRSERASRPWPTHHLAEVLSGQAATLRALIREYLFISLFRACAESLACENASRLASMERAERNIDELLESLHSTFHRLRQDNIDAELFDVISGFEALS
jgi:F-type H+-transporting ATPase subunit gamma